MINLRKHISTFRFVAHITFHMAWEAKMYYGVFFWGVSYFPSTSRIWLNCFFFSWAAVRFCCVATVSSPVRPKHHSPDCWQLHRPGRTSPHFSQARNDPVSRCFTVPTLPNYLRLGYADRKLEKACSTSVFWWLICTPCCAEVLDADTHQIKQRRGKAAWQLKKKKK